MTITAKLQEKAHELWPRNWNADKYITFAKPDYLITLPLPPSVNQLYKNAKRGRVKSEKYKSWINIASIFTQGLPRHLIEGQVDVVYLMQRPDKRKRDCANFEKALSDFIVSRGVIEDDSKIRSNTQVWLEEKGRDVTCMIYKVS